MKKISAQQERAGIKILIVDDDPDMVEIISLIIGHAGYTVIEAFSGQQGLDLAARHRPHVILLDIMMPDLDGWRVFDRLRAAEATRAIPVVALTAKSQSIDRMIGLHIMKFDDYVTKPFGRKQLLRVVENIFKNKKLGKGPGVD